jgi:elongation factor 1-alpha
MSNPKPHLSVVITGHVDSGKSTTTGRLMMELGNISQREMDKLKAEADRLGKSSFLYAFYTDTNKEERARGVTINCTTKEFFTDRYHYTIIDAPGHRDFIKNFVQGAASADVGVLMVPADGNFVTSIQKADRAEEQVAGQTREHARILCQLGVKQLIVGINKMDSDTAAYKQERYEEIVNEVRRMLISVGWPKMYIEKSVPFVPMSGFKGDNLIKPSENMPWYTGCDLTLRPEKPGDKPRQIRVHTLLDCLNDMATLPPRCDDKPVRVCINGILKIKGVGDVITGRVEQGVIHPGDEVKFIPTHTEGTPCIGKVFTIEMHHKQIDHAGAGDNCGFNIKGLDKANMPKVGDIMILRNDNTLKKCTRFVADIIVLDHPGELKKGYTPVVFARTARSACRIVDIKWKSGKDTNNEKVENPVYIKAYDTAQIVMEPSKPLAVEAFNVCEGLSRLAAFDGNTAVMLMKVVEWE